MNKSKFLKRSLAAILAILMVVAMVPMSALAAETYDISVNSRKATPAEDGTSYAVTIYNTRLASIDWAPKPDRTAQLKTKRGITLDLPVSNLDLMSEATADKDGKVYTLDLIFTDTKTKDKTEAKLNVTVETSVPNDDVTLQAVRVNQTIGNTTYSAISGTKPENGKITIKIPLGMTYKDVNFETGDVTGNEAKIFVPSSPYAKVTYTQPTVVGAPDAEGAQGKVTVTAPTGRTATYSVVFEQEDGLKGMAVNFGASHSGQVNFSERTFEKGANDQILSVYTAYVNFDSVYKDEDDVDVVFDDEAHIIFSHEKNVQRVEDPADSNGELATWSTTMGQTLDEPIQSGEKGENTLKFKAATDGSGSYYTYLSVKTKANNDDNTHAYYGNTKLVLRPKSQEPDAKTAPILTELQFNGYESIYNEGSELAKSITVNVDASYYEQVGAGKLSGRISLKTSAAANVWILNQNGSRAKVPGNTTGSNRVGKPTAFNGTAAAASGESYVGNFNTKDRQFTIRVEDPKDSSLYNDYAVTLASSGHGTGMNTVKLVDSKHNVIAEAVKSTGNQFIFYVDKTKYADYEMTTPQIQPATDGAFTNEPATDADFETQEASWTWKNGPFDRTSKMRLKYNFDTDFFNETEIGAKLDPASTVTDGVKKEYAFQLRWAGDATDGKLVLEASDKSLESPEWKIVAVGEPDSTDKEIDFKLGNAVNDAGLASAPVFGTLTFTWLSGGQEGSTNTASTIQGTSDWFDAQTGATILTPARMAAFFATAVAVKDGKTDTAKDTTYTAKVNAWNKDVPDGRKTLNSALTSAWLVIESDDGVVLTPGGTLNNVKDKSDTSKDLKTTQVGVSNWGKDDTPYPTSGIDAKYEEHENYWNTLSNYWNDNYLITLDSTLNNTQGEQADTASDGNADAILVMTTSNLGASNNNNKQTWTIRFERKDKDPVAPSYSEDAELNIKGATTAVDEDLIYDGRTRKTPDQVTLTSGAYNSTTEDAPYIGAIAARGDDHNNFKVEISELPDDGSGEKNASVVKIHVPEDYFVNGQIVYLDGVTASAKSTVYRGDETTALYANATKPASNWYETNLVQKYSLVMDDQTQTGYNDEASRQFKIQTSVWNGSTLNKNAVSNDNIIYVYSEKDSRKIDTAGQTLPTPTRKYYITFVKDNFDTIDTLSGVTPADTSTGITGTPNAYEKWLNLSVPFGKNWVNYRDDSSRDFKLNFTKGGKAILVDAAQDTFYKPFGTNASTVSAGTSYLAKARQELREAQIDEDTVFFVKENELWIYDQYTGKETKVTGRGLNTKFTYSGWGVITSGNAELHVFNEDQRSINTYRLTLNVNEASSAKEIVSIRVDETSAVNTSGTLWTVDLGPAGAENLSKVMLNITVSSTATIKSVGGKEYVANGTYDLTKPVEIIVADENGQTKTFTLSATGEDPNPPVDEKESDKYTDLPTNAGMREWAEKAINYGLMGNAGKDGEHLFKPNETTQRRWFALMVARADIMAADGTISTKEAADAKLLAEYGNKEPDFKDTANESDTAKAAIAYCQEKGIMKGDNGNFNPAGIVNRMEVASMLKNWLKLPEGNKENSSNFKDWNSIADWAKGNINAVVTDGIMTGQGDTFGKGDLTREQTAVVMVRAFERLKGITE